MVRHGQVGLLQYEGEYDMATATKSKKISVDKSQVSNGAEPLVAITVPYLVDVTVRGVAPLLFHSWNTESVETKSNAAKNSKVKKTDDLESYVYRTSDGLLGIAGKCLHGSICEAAKRVADPCSPRKSARDLCKAGLTLMTVVAPFEPDTKSWDYEDKQRVVIQRSAITRTRPAMKEGWTCTFRLAVNLPEYISPDFLHELLKKAGQFAGLCDYRPTYGRFNITKYTIIELD
jgi:hypothetical protein